MIQHHFLALLRWPSRKKFQFALVCLLLATSLLGGCAVFNTNQPGWDEFEAVRNGDGQAKQAAVKLHFETLGKGKPIILIHGFGATKYTWHRLAPELAKTHEVYLVDLKGFGDSPKPDDGAYSIYDQAHLLLDLIESERLEQITIIGHSFGGGVALVTTLFLNDFMPGVQEKLVLLDSIAYQQEMPFFIEFLATPVLGALTARLAPARLQVSNVLKKSYYNDERITEATIDAYTAPLQQAGSIDAMLSTSVSILPSDLEKLTRRYPSIDVPTMIIWGQYDEIVPTSVGRQLHAAIEQSTFHLIEDCGHMPHEECPEQTIRLVVDFLRND